MIEKTVRKKNKGKAMHDQKLNENNGTKQRKKAN